MEGSGAAGAPMLRAQDEPAPGRAGSAAHSRLVQRLRRRYPEELALLAPGTPTPDSMQGCLQALAARGHDTGARLRILRQLVVERLVVLDCEQAAPLALITQAITELAELALDIACEEALAELDKRHGAPIGTSGRWMAPVTDGRRLLAVHTPHIGGVLHEYQAGGRELRSRAMASGVCNHSLGQRELDLATWIGPVLLVPTQDRRAMRVFEFAAVVSERPRVSLPAPVVASRALRLDRRAGIVVLLEDRSVVWAAP